MYPFERFGDDAKAALTFAQEEAERSRAGYIGTEHVLIGLTRAPGSAHELLVGLGVDTESVRAGVQRMQSGPEGRRRRQIIPTSSVKTVIELAFQAARTLASDSVRGEHLLIAMLVEGRSVATELLNEAGAGLAPVCECLGVDAGEMRTLPRSRPSLMSSSPLQEVEGFHPLRSAPEVGTRVLVHDGTPPYRLWDGTITERSDSEVTVLVANHPEHQLESVPLDRLHLVPPRVLHCTYCEYQSSQLRPEPH
jgi:hypothetical protein